MLTSLIQKIFLATFQVLLQVSSTPSEIEDDFSPKLFTMVILMCVTILVLMGIGIVLGAFLIGASLIGLAIGVISISLLVGYLDRSITTAVKTLVLIISAILGVPLGILSLSLLKWLQGGHYPHTLLDLVIPGGTAGIIGGVIIGLILLKIAVYVKRLLLSKYGIS